MHTDCAGFEGGNGCVGESSGLRGGGATCASRTPVPVGRCWLLAAARKTRHVCRQQINENKVAPSSYSGAPAERSASIYTTQGSDLIWETDLHPRTRMAHEEEDDAKEEEEDEEEREAAG